MTLGKFFLLIGASSWAVAASAQEARQVLNGDVIYTATATSFEESEALTQAEARAVRLLSIECSVPPRDSKVFEQKVAKSGNQFQATIQLGVALADCEKARNAPAEVKSGLANHALTAARLPAPPSHLRHSFDIRVEARENEREEIRKSLAGRD